ncbi:hypothetical protein [Marinobacter halophilus]|uniref:Uncharacterized protein n=1 Tax=Marinobacter halophilus TaxID=1323740 RepID=A0A2T1KJU4_9GAMM|nr:hypothetical protein [Marinobacter halophilus]PSF10414.1 hypothetical protein C7H08_02695 [Marinobacter halophilus]GGC70554.1 hypothetical protein GCM10011362_18840 [Marinobacter halophilus]
MSLYELCRASLSGGLLPVLLWMALTPTAAASDLDVTMRMVEDTEDLTGAVTREIRLPDLPALAPDGNAGKAAEAPGRERSLNARERGREFGQSASERARDARGEKPEFGIDGLPEAARDRKPELPPQSSRP